MPLGASRRFSQSNEPTASALSLIYFSNDPYFKLGGLGHGKLFEAHYKLVAMLEFQSKVSDIWLSPQRLDLKLSFDGPLGLASRDGEFCARGDMQHLFSLAFVEGRLGHQ